MERDDDILEVIEETIAEVTAICRITLYDIYGAIDGFHVVEFKIQEEENKAYEQEGPVEEPDYDL